MNFHYSTYIYNTRYRPANHSSNFNEDLHCDNEVNLILKKSCDQSPTEQSPKIFSQKSQQSADINQIDQYYFIPIHEQNSTTILPENNVTDNSSLLLISDFPHPSILNLFDVCSRTSSTSNMNSSATPTTVNQSNPYSLTDTNLAALLVSTTSNDSMNNHNTLDDVFLNQFTDLVYSSSSSMIDPPPGFENFLFDPSVSSSDFLLTETTNQMNTAIQTPVSSSDTINFSQLLQSTTVDPQQQAIVGNLRSSSHSSFNSDEQSIFVPIYSSSSYATSQIYSPNTPSSSTMTTNSAAKSHISNSLSSNNNNNNNNNHYLSSASLIPNSTTDSPIENEKRITDGINPSSHIFSSTNSFFTNGRTDFPSLKFPSNHLSSTDARTSSSTSSSSSIDDALIQLTQQQQQHAGNVPKLFNNASSSIFQFSSLPTKANIDKQQEQAVHDNINFLASMTIASTPATPIDSPMNLPRQRGPPILQQQTSSPSRNKSTNMHELIQNLNEICYKGFDELNALIQEQRWVQNYINMNGSLTPSPSIQSNSCSSRILIVCEYFIFKCKKVEITASQVFEFLADGKAELRLRDLIFVFKSWKEAIFNAEQIHQEEENKLRLSTDHPQSYYMTESVLQAVFDRISNAIRQLCHVTQQVRAAFQYATWNVFQTSSRPEVQSQSSIPLAQFQAMQQPKSSSIHYSNGSIRTTP